MAAESAIEILDVSSLDMENADELGIESVAHSSPSEFHQFPKLPLELREAIWWLALPRRIFDLRRNNTGPSKYEGYEQPRYFDSLKQPTAVSLAPPVLVKVSREARAVALRSGSVRTVARHWATNPDMTQPSQWFRTWFDPTTDMICISEWGLLGKEWGVNTPSQFDIDAASLCFSYGALYQEPGRQLIRQRLGRTSVWSSNTPQYSFYTDSIAMKLLRSALVDDIFGSDSKLAYSTFVDIRDIGKLKRMRQLFTGESYVACWRPPQVLDLLDNIIDPAKNLEYDDEAHHELRNLWLVAHADSISHNDPIRIGIRKFPGARHESFNMHKINQQHPWSRSVLEGMPEFRLMIRFQLYLAQHG
jgi:hypothetical protein